MLGHEWVKEYDTCFLMGTHMVCQDLGSKHYHTLCVGEKHGDVKNGSWKIFYKIFREYKRKHMSPNGDTHAVLSES